MIISSHPNHFYAFAPLGKLVLGKAAYARPTVVIASIQFGSSLVSRDSSTTDLIQCQHCYPIEDSSLFCYALTGVLTE